MFVLSMPVPMKIETSLNPSQGFLLINHAFHQFIKAYTDLGLKTLHKAYEAEGGVIRIDCNQNHG